MKKSLRIAMDCLLLAGSVCMLSGCGKKAPSKKAGPARMIPKAIVGVGKVTLEDEIQKRRYTGQILSKSEVRVVPRVSGEILSVGFKDGAYVKPGQLLYTLDPIQYEAAYKSAYAKVAQNKAKLDYAQKNYNRTALLYTKKITSQDSVESSESALDALKASVMESEAELIRAKDNLKNTRIVSPINGIAGVTKFTKGNYITPSSGELVSIIQVQPIRVAFSISTADYLNLFGSLKNLKQYASVRLQLSNGTVYPEEGRIELMNNEANLKTDSILIYAEFPNKDLKLLAGSTVNVTLTKKTSRKLPAVLPSAVMHDSRGSYVYLPDDKNIVSKRYVVPGNMTDNYQLIQSGLKEGERVITHGTHKTMPGGEIIPQTSEK